MRRSLARFKISGGLITICIGPFQICIHKILDLGQGFCTIRGTFNKRMKGLCTYVCMYVYIYVCICIYTAVCIYIHKQIFLYGQISLNMYVHIDI